MGEREREKLGKRKREIDRRERERKWERETDLKGMGQRQKERRRDRQRGKETNRGLPKNSSKPREDSSLGLRHPVLLPGQSPFVLGSHRDCTGQK